MADAAVLIRTIHTLAMGALVGGAILAAAAPAASRAYERVFWPALGLMVLAGVGNLGAFGAGLPPPSTRWGALFTAKMTLVAALLAVSAVRARLVARPAPTRALVGAHAATATILLGIVTLAVVMAHG